MKIIQDECVSVGKYASMIGKSNRTVQSYISEGLPTNVNDLPYEQCETLASIPRKKLGEETLNRLGHRKKPILNAIRAKCFYCAGKSYSGIRKCVLVDCSLWVYRTGKYLFKNINKSRSAKALMGRQDWVYMTLGCGKDPS